jgi:Uncharacterized protein conserved in bacteria
MPLNPERVYMLAADHRWQWEEFCDARLLPRERIRDAKRVAYDGFVRARERSTAAHQFGALLIDEQYSSVVIADALRAGLAVGTPAEKAGAIPLAWATDPFSAALTGAFVKVLARYRRDDKAETLAEQWASSSRCRPGAAARASRSCSKCSWRERASPRTSSNRRDGPRCSPSSSPRRTAAA